MKKNGKVTFVVSVLIILLTAFTMIKGLSIGDYKIEPVKNLLKLGLDLKGGVYIEEEITDKNITKDTITRTKQLLELRVNGLGVSESTIAETGGNRIRIEMPGIYDAKKALDQVGRTGKLTFVGPNNDIVLTGKDVKDATVGVGQDGGEPIVQLKLNEEGAKKFADATGKYIHQNIAIKMDEEVVSNPQVQSVIPNGEAMINGMKDIEEAKRLAGIIKSGSLPVTLAPATVKTIGPSLGAEAIPTSVKAGVIGISIVMLFMLLYYKIPGLIADFALTVYIILTIIIFISIKATLTLPGIAGLLLSVGMAVDANVLIFERTKEEIRLGKSLKTAVDAGFHRAFPSILDSNITTLIAGFALYFIGTGSVKGFALTLIIGVICSMFTAITVTRFLLKSFVNSGWLHDVKYFRPIVK